MFSMVGFSPFFLFKIKACFLFLLPSSLPRKPTTLPIHGLVSKPATDPASWRLLLQIAENMYCISQLAPKISHTQPGNVKHRGSHHLFTASQMLFQIFLCPATQGPCSCLFTLLKGAGRGPLLSIPFPSSSGLPEGGDHSSYRGD